MQKSGANVRKPPRLCENAQEPTRRRIVFSIALFPVAATALLLFRLTKLSRTFYAQIECLSFHTASTLNGHCQRRPTTARSGWQWSNVLGSRKVGARSATFHGSTFEQT